MLLLKKPVSEFREEVRSKVKDLSFGLQRLNPRLETHKSKLINDMDYWNEKWNQGQSPWHSSEPNPYLVQFMPILCSDKTDPCLQFFLPLCGKAGDIIWLYNKGHRVMGIEGSVKAINEFFTENQIPFSIVNISASCNKYLSLDEKIQIFCCDFFQFDVQWMGDVVVDRVFDRGSLVAIESEDRPRYSTKMKDILFRSPARKFQYLLSSYEYDPKEFAGPPRTVWRDEIRQLFADLMDVDLLGEFDESSVGQARFQVSRMNRIILLLTPKNAL